MRVCNNGITRCVIIFHNKVIKIPRFWWSWFWFLQGMLCNLRERKWWNGVKQGEIAEWFCPVLYADPFGLFIIMPRCEQVEWKDLPHPDEIPHHTDYKAENFGRYKGRIVLIDYGS